MKRSARPERATTAAVSPPPTTVVASSSARARASPKEPPANCSISKTPRGAVPDDRSHVAERLFEGGERGRADVENHLVRGNRVDGDGGGGGLSREFRGDDRVHGEADGNAGSGGASEDVAGQAQQIVLDEGGAHVNALRLQEGVGHPPAHEEAVEPGQQVVDGGNLGADLGAPDDGGEGAGRGGDERAEVAHLLLQQEAGDGGEVGGNARGRGVGAVGRAEGVVDVQAREPGEGGGEGVVVGLLLGVEAQVLEERHLARGEGSGDVLGGTADAVLGEGDVLPKKLGQSLSDGREAEIGAALAPGATEVGTDEHGRAVLGQVADGGERLADAGVVGDGASIKGHVEVGAQEDPLAIDADVAHGALANPLSRHV